MNTNLNLSAILWNANGFLKTENKQEVLTENGNECLVSDEKVNDKSDNLPQSINNDESKQSVNYHHNGNIIDFKLCNDLLTSFEEFTNCELMKNEPVKVNRRKSKTFSVDETLNNFIKFNGVTKSPQQKDYEVGKSVIEHSAQFSISNSDRKRGLSNIIQELKTQQFKKDRDSNREEPFHSFGDTPSTEALENNSQATLKSSRKRRLDRIPPTHSRNGVTSSPSLPADYHHLNNNNNHVKNERLSPGTPDTSSRSVTPSSASHPDTPPSEQSILTPGGRNYSDFMRSLAAKYNNANPNDYFNAVRNGFTPHLDSRFKPSPFPTVVPSLVTPSNSRDEPNKKSDFSSVINPFTSPTLFSPFIDMSSTQTLLAMVKTAKEAELQGLLKSTKRHDASSPLDLSAAAPPIKKPRLKLPNLVNNNITVKRDESQSPKLNEDISNWNVDDVCNFVAGIDICAEYAKNFREQQIDGSGLPLLTEEHLTTKMNMKLGPALKLRSLLARKLGSCTICLHCTHCHRNSSVSPDLGNVTGNTSDSGGTS